MKAEPTYVYENDKTYIMVEGSVIGTVTDDALIEEEAERLINESATHVVTPNGLKGKILGRTQDLWGEQVTVRFENGRIVHLPVGKLSFTQEAKEDDIGDNIGPLHERLAASVDTDLPSLKARVRELEKIKAEARHLIDTSKLSSDDVARAGELITQASYELNEIGDVMRARHEHLAESFEPPTPAFEIKVAEQGGPSRDNTWLDEPLNEMIAEAEATDFTKLMDEGPEAFVAELDAPVLADSGVTRAVAANWIRQHTAAADDNVRDKYERVWLERVEALRRKALADHKEVVQKEAAAAEVEVDSPDEAFFL